MKIKKGLLALLIIVLVVGFIGCSSGEDAPTEDTTAAQENTEEQATEKNEEVGESEATDNQLVVATNANFPPFEYHEIVEGEDTITGFDIDLIHEIGKEIGKEIVIEDMDFDGIVAAVQAQKVDMAISGISITEERKEKVAFSDPYYMSTQTLLIQEDGEEFANMDELKGKTVGSQLGTTSDDIISSFEGVEVKKLNNATDAVQDLINGRIDAVIVDDSVALEFMKEREGLKMIVPEGLNIEDAPMGMIFPKEEEDLLNDVNGALQDLKDSGKLNEIIRKYGLIEME